ncbi:MAG: hypothetical protein JO356_01135 [Acidobacteria bacterium]|nr:hypothetical protein [Acidobacteriota bacterium]
MTKIRRKWLPLTIGLSLVACLLCIGYVFAQVSPQITGSGAPSNPCVNGGQQYLDTTNHVLYSCPSNGSNWANIQLGNAAGSGWTNNGATLTAALPILLPDGSLTAPSYSFANQPGLGFSRSATDRIGVMDGSHEHLAILANNGSTVMSGAGGYGFVSSANTDGLTPSVYLSYATSNTLSIGTAPGNTNSNLQVNLLTKYNGVTTAGLGVVGIYGATSQKSESAADSNVLTFTPPYASTGTYRIHFVLSVSAANTATLGWTATWKDSNGNAQAPANLSLVQSGTAAPALTFTTSAAGNYYGTALVDIDTSQTAIVVKLTFSGTSFSAKASATVEQVQ